MKENFMEDAFKQAQKAREEDEVPIGAVIVKDNEVISRAFNKRNKTKNACHHAEIIAIEKACKKIGDWRLDNCVMYVTLEPCPMCSGAIVNSRLKKVVVGARDKTSQTHLFEQILNDSRLNHKTEIEWTECFKCSQIISDFFQQKRSK